MGEAWIDSIIPEKSEFTIENLPWGVFTDETTPGSICVGIGNHIVDVHAWALSWTDELGFGEDFALKVKDALLQVRRLQPSCLLLQSPCGVPEDGASSVAHCMHACREP